MLKRAFRDAPQDFSIERDDDTTGDLLMEDQYLVDKNMGGDIPYLDNTDYLDTFTKGNANIDNIYVTGLEDIWRRVSTALDLSVEKDADIIENDILDSYGNVDIDELKYFIKGKVRESTEQFLEMLLKLLKYQ